MAKINWRVSEANDFAFRDSDDFVLRGVDDAATSSKVSNGKAGDPVAPVVVVDNADLVNYGAPVLEGDNANIAAFNLAWTLDPHDFTAGLPGLLHDPNEYTVLRNNPVFGLTGDWDPTTPGDQNVRNQIDNGLNLYGSADGIITWGFYDFITKLGPNANGEHKAYFQFTQAQKDAAIKAIGAWDELIATDFQLVDFNAHDARQWGKGDAPDILMANTLSGPAQAWAYLPTAGGNGAWDRAAGDVWIGAAADNRSDLFDGGYGLTTQVHELGHSLGLSHPGNYNFGDDSDGDGQPDPITYDGDAFYWQDSRQYSIMSYFNPNETGSNMIDWNLMRVMYASTPMVHDIWIIQQKYGVETSTRTGDSVYGFNSTADVTNSAMKFTDTLERATIFSIWDAAGNDTLDLSGYYTPSVIDLREGAYSSAGGLGAYNPAWVGATPDDDLAAYLTFINANNASIGLAARTAVLDLYFGGRQGPTPPMANEGVPWSDMVGRDWLMENNIGIAYGATIENAKGGHGNDRINGNQVNNQFWGMGGADTFIIADYSTIGVTENDRTLDGQMFNDESVDTIMDFESGVDRIDLSELGVTWANLSVDGTTWTVERGDDDLSFVVLGSTAVQSDFFFG